MKGHKLWHDDVRHPPKDCPTCGGRGRVPGADECPACQGTGSSWWWARTNDIAKIILMNNEIALISMDHDLGGHMLDPTDPETFYFKGSVEDDGKKLAEWMVETGNVPINIHVHSWNPIGVDRIVGVFKSAQKAGMLKDRHFITVQKAERA